MLTSMESLKVRETKDIYLPRYMVSTTPFTVGGLPIHSKASNRWTSSAIVLKSTEVSILFVCFLDTLNPASAVLSDAPTVSHESRDQ